MTKEIEMNQMKNEITLLVGSLFGTKSRMVVLALAVALFVLAAGAPNATIGIGK